MIDSDEIAGRFPDVEPFGYIIEILSRIGVALNSGNGVHGLTWQEIDAFVARTHLHLTGWEAETVKRLSALYASSVLKYDNQDVQSPYRNEEEQKDIAKGLKSFLRGIVIKDKHGFSDDTDQSRHPASKSG
tara:strand:- start:86 stop:478 length:393 start_codon:yes stop_codon:yes gene_type:complete